MKISKYTIAIPFFVVSGILLASTIESQDQAGNNSSSVTISSSSTSTTAGGASGTGSLATTSSLAGREITVDRAAMTPRALAFTGGVQTHFAYAAKAGYNPDEASQRIAELGVNSFRDDIYWNAFSPDWDLYGSHLPEELKTFWNKTAAKPLLIVNNGNPFIAGTSPPITESGRKLFAAFATRAADVSREKNAMYEVWNEWNSNAVLGRERLTSEGEANDPRAAMYYAPLAIATSNAIKAKHPGSTVLVAASGDDEGWPWTAAVVQQGALKAADGLSVHMYNHCQAPAYRTATEFIDRLNSLRKTIVDRPGGTKPIYVTEFGWPTGTSGCSLNQEDQAKNVGQFMLFSAATPWIGGAWYYELKDSGSNRSDIQDNFGLYDNRNLAKLSACTMRESMALINKAEAMEVERPQKDMFVVKIRTSWGVQVIAWTTSNDKTGTVQLGGNFGFEARAMCGNPRAISADRKVAVGARPVVMTIHYKDKFTLFADQ